MYGKGLRGSYRFFNIRRGNNCCPKVYILGGEGNVSLHSGQAGEG